MYKFLLPGTSREASETLESHSEMHPLTRPKWPPHIFLPRGQEREEAFAKRGAATPTEEPPPKKAACRDWVKGHCPWGDQCNFSHDEADKGKNMNKGPAAPGAKAEAKAKAKTKAKAKGQAQG